MMTIFNKIREYAWVLRSLPLTIFFNFYYLPFRQAYLLPIWLYKPKFKKLKGSISISSKCLKTGMVRLGYNRVNVYPNSGISLEINGDIIFNGTCYIGNDSFLSVNNGIVTFGDNFNATASVKFISNSCITFGNDVLVGWDNLICDTDFHVIKDLVKHIDYPCCSKIIVGNHVWIATGCTIMKGSKIPNGTIIAAKSLVNKDLVIPENSLVAGCPVQLKKTNVIWQI